MNKDIILECVVGSQAYNLATPESDTDIKGIFILPNEAFLGLKEPTLTYDYKDPDKAYHEIEKFMYLCMKANPTITELLWVDKYLKLTDIGQMLIDNRKLFLSQLAKKTYFGYAYSQLHRNYRNASGIHDYREGKHARHIFRLLLQGRQLLETGELRVRLTDEERSYIFSFQDMSRDQIFEAFEKEAKKFDETKTCLPEEPNFEKINNLLLEIRQLYSKSKS